MTKKAATRKKLPKTRRGWKTREKLLEAAEAEFGNHGFHSASISGITNTAGVALGTFYTYFESKEEIFRALVSHLGQRVRAWTSERTAEAPDRLAAERLGMQAYLEFVREHPGLYRIISESEFVANDVFIDHYTGFARAYQANLKTAANRGEIRQGDLKNWSWAIIGMVVFLGMRFGEWDEDTDPAEVARLAADLIANGIAQK